MRVVAYITVIKAVSDFFDPLSIFGYRLVLVD